MNEALSTKKCSKCGEVKSLLHFHKHKQSKDGHNNYCKLCNCAASKAYAVAHKEEVAAKAKLRGKKANYTEDEWAEIIKVKQEKALAYFEANPDKLEQKRKRGRKKSFTDAEWEADLAKRRERSVENAQRKAELNRAYRESNPKKYVAQSAVGNALRDGILVKQPCEVCGSLTVHGHHPDYDKPLNVMWLCPEHHKDWHRENGEGLNGN